MKNSLIYVILPVHNRIEITRKFINCLTEQTYQNFHLILVDDGCTDGTSEFVSGAIQNLTVIRGNGELWWGGSLHKAYKYLIRADISNDDIILISNDDTTFEVDYFEKLISDDQLTHENLVISPGHNKLTGITEYGFKFDWEKLRANKLESGEQPDAITTRGLYMYFSAFRAIGGFPHHFVPHYLSDFEYTIRARRKGFNLVISKETLIYIDRTTTGVHRADSKSLRELLYNALISKKTAYNFFYWGNFILLAAPRGHKLKGLKINYMRFYKMFISFCKVKIPGQQSLPAYAKAYLKLIHRRLFGAQTPKDLDK